MEEALRYAISKQELFLLYQPKVELATGFITGVEALLRWQSPEFGLVRPDTIIPLAEETKLILPIGEWILESACRQQTKWLAEGHDISMAVNISSVQFKDSELPQKIGRIIRETGIATNRLELELTESILVENPKYVSKFLATLRQLGCSLAIDDFGTGYSSLSYLKSFPLNVLKIDKSFIFDMEKNPSDRAIVQSIVNLARNLSMKTVAEGVENLRHRDILTALGCDYAQGYYYSRPEHPEKIFQNNKL